jgi:hypothetical protein
MPKARSNNCWAYGVRDVACADLERQAMQVLGRNWRCRLGESEIFSEDATVERREGMPGAATRNVLGESEVFRPLGDQKVAGGVVTVTPIRL